MMRALWKGCLPRYKEKSDFGFSPTDFQGEIN